MMAREKLIQSWGVAKRVIQITLASNVGSTDRSVW